MLYPVQLAQDSKERYNEWEYEKGELKCHGVGARGAREVPRPHLRPHVGHDVAAGATT